MMNTIGIIGKGAQAKEIAGYCLDQDSVVAFYALDPQYFGDNATDEIDLNNPTEEQRSTAVIISLGAPGVKRELVAKWPGTDYATIISPKSYTARTAQIGEGSVIAPFGSVGPDSTVGVHAYVNVGSSVPHDCRIGDYVTIAPGARLGGGVTLGAGCFVGIGATIKNGVTLADGCVVGAGAVVLNDVDQPNSVLVGVPAKTIKVNGEWMRAI